MPPHETTSSSDQHVKTGCGDNTTVHGRRPSASHRRGTNMESVADSKGGGQGGGGGRPALLAHIFFKSRFFPCKTHIFRCAHLRQMRTQLIKCLPPPPFQIFWIRHCMEQFARRRDVIEFRANLLIQNRTKVAFILGVVSILYALL